MLRTQQLHSLAHTTPKLYKNTDILRQLKFDIKIESKNRQFLMCHNMMQSSCFICHMHQNNDNSLIICQYSSNRQ